MVYIFPPLPSVMIFFSPSRYPTAWGNIYILFSPLSNRFCHNSSPCFFLSFSPIFSFFPLLFLFIIFFPQNFKNYIGKYISLSLIIISLSLTWALPYNILPEINELRKEFNPLRFNDTDPNQGCILFWRGGGGQNMVKQYVGGKNDLSWKNAYFPPNL